MHSNTKTAARDRDRSLDRLRRWTVRLVAGAVGLAGALSLLAAASIPGRGAASPFAGLGSSLSSLFGSPGSDNGGGSTGSGTGTATAPPTIGAPATPGATQVPQPPSGGVSQPSGGRPAASSGGS